MNEAIHFVTYHILVIREILETNTNVDKNKFQNAKVFQSAHQPTGHALTQFSNLSSGSQPPPPTYHTTGGAGGTIIWGGGGSRPTPHHTNGNVH